MPSFNRVNIVKYVVSDLDDPIGPRNIYEHWTVPTLSINNASSYREANQTIS